MEPAWIILTVLTALGALFAALIWDARAAFYVLLACLTLAHPYASGILVTAVILTVARERVIRLTDFNGVVLTLWLLWGTAAAVSLLNHNPTPRGVFVWLKFAWVGFVLLLLCQLQRDDVRLRDKIPLAAFVGSGVAAWILNGLAYATDGRLTSLIGPNESCFVLVLLGIPAGLYERKRYFDSSMGILTWIVLIVGIPVSCALNESRSMLAVALLVPALHLVLTSFRRASAWTGMSAIAVIVLIIGQVPIGGLVNELFTLENLSNVERLMMLEQSWQLFLEHPLLGHGWGTGESIFPRSPVTLTPHPHPHNTLAHMAVELGIVGILFLVGLFAYLLYRAWHAGRRDDDKLMFLGLEIAFVIAAASMVDALLYGASRSLPLVIAVSMFVARQTVASLPRRVVVG